MNRKLLVIGSNSPHVSRFINLVKELFTEVVYVGESSLETDLPIRQHLVNFRSANPFKILSSSRKLREIIEREKPDLTHIQQVNRVAFAASRHLVKLNRKYVVTAWGSDVLIAPNKNRFFRKITHFVLQHASYVTADSNHMIGAINKLSPTSLCELVYFGIEPIQPGKKENIIYSNRSLKELYNVAEIIDKFAEFHQLNPDWKLVIAGRGNQEEMLRKKVTQLNLSDHVIFIGWLSSENNCSWYRKSSIYISIPSSDGTSVSLLEAMSAGCVPVVSDLPVAYEWIKNDENGIVQKKGENGLLKALKLDQEKVAALNSEIIKSRATGAITTNQFKTIYDRVTHVAASQK